MGSLSHGAAAGPPRRARYVMNRKKWALLSALLLATVAPLPTLTPPQLIPAVSAKQHIESSPARDTDGDPEEWAGKPARLSPPNNEPSVGSAFGTWFKIVISRIFLVVMRAGGSK